MGIYHIVYRFCPPVDKALRSLVKLARGDALVDMASALGIDLGRNNVHATIEAVADILHRK